MSKCLKIPTVPLGYRHARKFIAIYRKYMKVLRNIRSGKVAKYARKEAKKRQ